MRFHVGDQDVTRLGDDLCACFASEGDPSPRGVKDAALLRKLASRMAAEGFAGRRGDSLVWNADGRRRSGRFLVIGLGSPGRLPDEAIGEGAARAARAAGKYGARSLGLVLPPVGATQVAAQVRAATEGVILGAYRFDRYLTDPGRRSARIASVHITATGPDSEVAAGVRAGEVTARAVCLARDLVNEPPSDLTPAEMARRAIRTARESGLRVKVLRPAELRHRGMRALLAVGRGSHEPPRVVHLVYRPRRGRPRTRIALVGKGVTFDTGGLNLKPVTSMADMKGDMSGAAAVLAAMSTLREIGCRSEVHGFLGLVENAIGGRAFKPGDILLTLAGKSVEVRDTDAEGRLVLSDLLAHAAATVRPDRMVDLATLTGACVVALGPLAAGVFSRHDDFRDEILDAGKRAGEKLWPMPLYEEYLERMQEGPADLRNVGPRWGGAINAALFLGEFVPRDLPWVHLDIAGPAFLDQDRPEAPAGGTGAGVRTLIRWLERA